MKIAIIGGGASGLVASIYAKTKENEVIILERNKSCGKKILMTGNGRCNYWNQNFSSVFFHTNEKEKLEEIITQENKGEIERFFSKIGIVPKIKDGYYYPFSSQAVSVLDALLCEARNLGVQIKTDFFVESILKKENYFLINHSLKFDKVILSTGGSAAPKTGSDGNGYTLAKSLNHTIYNPLPSLVQLVSKGSFLKEWAGIRSEVLVSIYENGKFIAQEYGEIQLTDYGISGICVFNLSPYVALGLERKHNMTVKINFIPFHVEGLLSFLEKRNELVKKRTIAELLEGFLNKKLIAVLLKLANINSERYYEELEEKEKNNLLNVLECLELPIIKTKTFEEAQVTLGGVSLNEINPKTMESKKVSGLYFTGEILDATGKCGGYNLGFAWISGMLAGRALKNEENSYKI